VSPPKRQLGRGANSPRGGEGRKLSKGGGLGAREVSDAFLTIKKKKEAWHKKSVNGGTFILGILLGVDYD